MNAHTDVHEPSPPEDSDSALSFSMEGYAGIPPSGLISRYWAPGWNSGQALNKFQSEVAGPLWGGDPGKRLIEPSGDGSTDYSPDALASVTLGDDEWLVIPTYHVFGSDELSVLSPGIRHRSVEPYLGLGAESATGHAIRSGSLVRLDLAQGSQVLPVRIVPGLGESMAVLPVGLPGMGWYKLPARGRITPFHSEQLHR